MKKTVLLLMAAFGLFFICPAKPQCALDGDSQMIPIVNKGNGSNNNPRTPACNPFNAVLYDSYVILSCLGDYGDVSVELTSTAGDNYSTTFDTADGAILIPVSGNTGYYILSIITQSGQEFVGEFNI